MLAASSSTSSTCPAAAAAPSQSSAAAAKPSPEAIIQPHQLDPLCVKIREQTLCVTRTALEKALGWTPKSRQYEELVKNLDVEKAESVCADFSPASTSGEKANLDTQPAVIFLRPGDTLSTVPDLSAEKLHDELSRELRDAAREIGLLGDEQASTRNSTMLASGSAKDQTATSKSSVTETTISSTTEPHQGLRANGAPQRVEQQSQPDSNKHEAHEDEYEQVAAPLLETSRKACEFSERVEQCHERRRKVLGGIVDARAKLESLETSMTEQMHSIVPCLVHDVASNIVSDAVTRAGGVGISFRLMKMGGQEIANGTALCVAAPGRLPLNSRAQKLRLTAEFISVFETLEGVMRQFATTTEAAFMVGVVEKLERQLQLPPNNFDKRARFREPVRPASLVDGVAWTGGLLDAQSIVRHEFLFPESPFLPELRFSSRHRATVIVREREHDDLEFSILDEDIPKLLTAGSLCLRVCPYRGSVQRCFIICDAERNLVKTSLVATEEDPSRDNVIDLNDETEFPFLVDDVPILFCADTDSSALTFRRKYEGTYCVVIELKIDHTSFRDDHHDWDWDDVKRAVVEHGILQSHSPAEEDDEIDLDDVDDIYHIVRFTLFANNEEFDDTDMKTMDLAFKTADEAIKFYDELKLVHKIIREYSKTTAWKDIVTGKDNCEGLEWKHVFPAPGVFKPENVKFLVEELQEPASPDVSTTSDEHDNSLEQQEIKHSSCGEATMAIDCITSLDAVSGRLVRERLLPDEETAAVAGGDTAISTSAVSNTAVVSGSQDDAGILRADQTWLDVATAVFEKRRRKKEPMREPIEIKCVFPQL
ncbi:unnamed protein product [Amoebophrya sp. A120]|nr:unnamed protein product [Amoebophrya sp. A120]|eukprot:GSA120T00022891001.1